MKLEQAIEKGLVKQITKIDPKYGEYVELVGEYKTNNGMIITYQESKNKVK